MILRSKNQGGKDIFDGKDTKSARQICPQSIWKVARKKLDQLDFAASLNDLRSPPKNKLEALEGDRRGQYSIRINNQYRICFIWSDDGVEEIKVVDYH